MNQIIETTSIFIGLVGAIIIGILFHNQSCLIDIKKELEIGLRRFRNELRNLCISNSAIFVGKKISEEQKEMLKSFLKIKKAVEGDAELRREGLSLAREYTNDSLRASYLMEKAKRTSPHSSGLSLDHRISQILDILVERGVGTTTEEIRAEMEREGTALSDSRIRSILRNLREAGVVDKENGSIRALWRIHAA
jgi:hypothetical protein